MKYGTRKAGDRFEEDESPATKEAGLILQSRAKAPTNTSTSGDPEQYEEGGKYNSGERIGDIDYTEKYDFPQRATEMTFSSFGDNAGGTTENMNSIKSWINMNRDAQDMYSDTSSIAQRAIDNAEKNRYINTEALDKRINEREFYNRAKSDVIRSEIFGDVWKHPYIDEDRKPSEWVSAAPPDKIEAPNWEEMYEKYTDF